MFVPEVFVSDFELGLSQWSLCVATVVAGRGAGHAAARGTMFRVAPLLIAHAAWQSLKTALDNNKVL